jgi:hypothetical protein
VSLQASELFSAANQTASEAFAAIRTVAAFSLQAPLGTLYEKLLEKPQVSTSFRFYHYVLRKLAMFWSLPQSFAESKRSVSTQPPGSFWMLRDLVNQDSSSTQINTTQAAVFARAHASGLGFGFSQFAVFSVYALAFWYGGQLMRSGQMSFSDVLKVTPWIHPSLQQLDVILSTNAACFLSCLGSPGPMAMSAGAHMHVLVTA